MTTDQAGAVVALLDDMLGPDLLGVYLYGSAVLGGLRPHSDVDLLAVTVRPLPDAERRLLISALLDVSQPSGPGRSVELTVVVQGDVRPWTYPPRFDLQYGDWMRREFEAGDLAPWGSPVNPDLASLITMVLLSGVALLGPPAAEVLDPVPPEDHRRALLASVDPLLDDLGWDTRNVVLTLARIWHTLTTGQIVPKDEAATWVLARLPAACLPVLERARAVYLGEEVEQWDDLSDSIGPAVECMVREIRTG